jgi:hypothetical protein
VRAAGHLRDSIQTERMTGKSEVSEASSRRRRGLASKVMLACWHQGDHGPGSERTVLMVTL